MEGTGRVQPKVIRRAMDQVGYGDNHPTIYKVIVELDNPENQKNGGITVDYFVDYINGKLANKNSKQGIQKNF